MTYLEENKKLIELFRPCRVTDVRDGMDWCGYHHYGTVDWRVRPLFPARAVGIADENYFTKVFKAQTGETPTAFRRHHAGNGEGLADSTRS